MNPYVFIVGCPRSGTTLLQRIVNAHSRIAIIHETHWVWTFFKGRMGMTTDGWVTKEMVFRLVNHPRFGELQMTKEQIQQLIPSDRAIRYPEFVTAVFDFYAGIKGKDLAGDKTPRYCRDITLIHRLWPQAKFIHLIRDGRDVCLSAMDWKETPELTLYPTWSEDPIGTAALWWEMHVRLGRESGTSLPGMYQEVRYESLVTQPAKECFELCRFLGLAFEENMLKFHEGRTNTNSGISAKDGWWSITQGLRNWRLQMPSDDVARFDEIAGDLLNEIGYECICDGVVTKNKIDAATLRAQFAGHVQSLGHKIPHQWIQTVAPAS